MRLVGQLVVAAAALAAAHGCDRRTQLSTEALAAEAEANARMCAQSVMALITLAFGPPPVQTVATRPPSPPEE
jgi:hypothetical protein